MSQHPSPLPERSGFDATSAFLRTGYRFVGQTCDALGSDAFRARMMLRPVVFMRGPDAARQFYREGCFTRRGAMPRTVVPLLQDWGSVQALDGQAHRHRKQIFAPALDPEALDRATGHFRLHWTAAARTWAGRTVALQREIDPILTRTALDWCGIPADEAEPEKRTAELSAMVAQAGSFGPSYLRARLLRRRSEAWARRVIAAVREGKQAAPEGSPLEVVAQHLDERGEALPLAVAAVELLNYLRPVVAVGRFIVFCAHALHVHGGMPPRGEAEMHAFVQEVRRLYPFFPVIAGRALEPFEWHGHGFERGDWVILDLYGTNHHPDVWEQPEAFRPERFLDWDGDAYTFIPQGGGDFMTEHRCPGERLTIALTQEGLRCLLATEHTVPPQDLGIAMNRFPTAPVSGFLMTVAASRSRPGAAGSPG